MQITLQKIREVIVDAYSYFYQYHNINQIELVVKKGWHPEEKSDGFLMTLYGQQLAPAMIGNNYCFVFAS